MKNMKIGKKLICTFIAVAIIASISGIVSIFTSSSMDTHYSDALVNYGFAQGDIGKTMLAISESRRCVRDIVSYTEPKYIDAAKADLEEATKEYNTYSEAVKQTLMTDEARALFDKAGEAMVNYRAKRDEVMALGETTDEEQSYKARVMMVEELDPIYNEVYTAWENLMDLKVTVGDTTSENLTRQADRTVVLNIVVTVAAMLIAIFMGMFVSRGISRPIGLCVDRLNLLAAGDLKSPVPDIYTKEETGMLADSTRKIVTTVSDIIDDMNHGLSSMANGDFTAETTAREKYVGDFRPLLNSMYTIINSLSNTLTEINISADQVNVGADQVSSTAQALAQGATEQASSIEELSATIADISRQIKENADNAANAGVLSDEVGSGVLESNQRMELMTSAMEDISNTSKEIGKIIKTINDIAFQTNILALNAAVEAARAGAAGKGFAVVADEVRNLAGKSAEAAKNTTDLIESSINAVNNGTKIADQTAEALKSVVEKTKTTINYIQQIAKASEEQANGASQITIGVDQISSVVQTNSATAEESAAASEELSGQANMLKELISSFKLRERSIEM